MSSFFFSRNRKKDEYQHFVFFACKSALGKKEKKKIEKYFSIYQRSGGGPCGSLTAVAEGVYSLAFKCLKDQQEVLKRSEHIVNISNSPLQLLVQESLPAVASSNSTSGTYPEEEDDNPTPQRGLKSSHFKEEDQKSPVSVEIVQGTIENQHEDDNPTPQQGLKSSHIREEDQKSPVSVEIVQGTIEDQHVDAVVSPMVSHHPLSTRVGNTLNEVIGPQLISEFRHKSGGDTMPGDSVLVEGFLGLPFSAVFFMNLVPWCEDVEETAVQILRLAINNTLTTCESRGFGSVAFPVLGAGVALRFPVPLVSSVLQEEISHFQQERTASSPLLVRIVIHPDDEEATESFKFVDQEQQSATMRIVLLGKTGSGKSHLANTIMGEELFTSYNSPNSGTKTCQSETKSVNGRRVTLIDTPGLFDTGRSEEDMKAEIMTCITKCAPGPHVFLIVLKVDKFTEQEQDVIENILRYFSDDALNYAAIVFTHGDELPEETTIEKFVVQNEKLNHLVNRCASRCHVFDNKHWNEPKTNYRSNKLHRDALLQTIDRMMMEKNGSCYSNEFLQTVGNNIQMCEDLLRESCIDSTPEEIKNEAKSNVSQKILIELAGIATGVLLGAFLGVVAMVRMVMKVITPSEAIKIAKATAVGAPAALTAAAAVTMGIGVVAGVATATAAVVGGIVGGAIGYKEAKEATTPMEAAARTAEAVIEKSKDYMS